VFFSASIFVVYKLNQLIWRCRLSFFTAKLTSTVNSKLSSIRAKEAGAKNEIGFALKGKFSLLLGATEFICTDSGH